uniref:Latrophilin 2 n=1 Tax=Nothobranchius kuhntae TaxID=321403 RepID=A0A1A8HL61_NOTKU
MGAFALLCLLGLTWSFGLFFISEASIVMAYLFTIFNTFQGMFIFIFHCLLQKKVRKEYSKCFRHTYCCGGLPTESSHGSTKTSTTRTSARYSSGTQSRIRRMWNDTVVDCGLSLDDAAFEKMIISELVHNNLRACTKSHQQQQHSTLRHPPPHQQPPQYHHHHHTERAPPKVTVVGGSSSEDDAIVADTSSLVHVGDTVGLELHPQRELEAPLIPQRTHSLLYAPQKKVRTDGGVETIVSQLTPTNPDDSPQSPNRDSLYTSMPNLRDSPCPESSPDVVEDLSPTKRSENEDVYYKSMPNLGAGHQLQAYYQIGRGSSDGFIIPINKEDCIPEGDVREGQMQLVTSL